MSCTNKTPLPPSHSKSTSIDWSSYCGKCLKVVINYVMLVEGALCSLGRDLFIFKACSSFTKHIHSK